MDILHKKNVKYFFQNAQKAKKQAKRNLDLGEKTTIIFKTIGSDILTTAELGAGKKKSCSFTWHVWYYFILDFFNY